MYPLYCDYVRCLQLPDSINFQQIYMCDPPRMYHPPRIHPPFQQLYATLPESTPPSQNIGLPPFQQQYYMRPSKNPPLPPRMYPSSQQIYYYATLPESTPPSQKIFPLEQLCATLPESTLPPKKYTPFFNNYMVPYQNLPLPPRNYPRSQELYVTLSEYTPPFQNRSPFQQIHMCDPPRIYSSQIIPPFQQL